jgi:hypothetical protein
MLMVLMRSQERPDAEPRLVVVLHQLHFQLESVFNFFPGH